MDHSWAVLDEGPSSRNSLFISLLRKESRFCHKVTPCLWIQTKPWLYLKATFGKAPACLPAALTGCKQSFEPSLTSGGKQLFSPKPHSSAITDMTALWLLRWWLKPFMPWKCHSLRSTNFNFVPCSQRHDVPGCISVVKSKQCHYLLGNNEKKTNRGWNMKCHYRKLVDY